MRTLPPGGQRLRPRPPASASLILAASLRETHELKEQTCDKSLHFFPSPDRQPKSEASIATKVVLSFCDSDCVHVTAFVKCGEVTESLILPRNVGIRPFCGLGVCAVGLRTQRCRRP